MWIIFQMGDNCNFWGCNCAFELCSSGINHDDRPWCDPNEKCSAKKFRNIIEVN